MKVGGFFSGGGGFEFASELMGWETLFYCEINEFCQTILKYYWPKATPYGDIKTTNFTIWRGRIDLLTGGFPCQPYSLAGLRKGTADVRHLWPEMLRGIREIRPRWVVGENVFGLVNWNDGMVFEQVQADLANEGYEVWPVILPAASIGAEHLRYRIWFVAHSLSDGHERNDELGESRCQASTSEGEGNKRQRIWHVTGGNVSEEFITNAYGTGLSEWFQERFTSVPGSPGTFQGREFTRTFTEGYWREFPTQSPICSGNDGLSSRLDGITFSKWRKESMKLFGNAIVPQVAYQIFKTIEQYESLIPLTNPTNK